MSSPTTIGTAIAGMATLPALVLTGHPWMAGAGLLVVLAASTFQSWHAGRAGVTRNRDVLTYASTSVSLGVDPSPVLEALHGRRGPDPDRHEDDLRTGRWVHLHPSDDLD